MSSFKSAGEESRSFGEIYTSENTTGQIITGGLVHTKITQFDENEDITVTFEIMNLNVEYLGGNT
jgi:hypothetical protein